MPAPRLGAARAARDIRNARRPFRAPGGARCPGGRLMKQFFHSCAVVCAWELKSFLLRPIAYVLLLAAVLLASWSFSWLVTLLSRGPVVPLRSGDDPIPQFLGPNVFL